MHLVRPQVFASIMPRAIPEEHHTNLIYASGVVELVCAAGLVRRTRWAAGASLATLAAVFPANVQMALDAGTGRNAGPSDSRAVAWGRLPLQLVMAWAALQARPERGALTGMEIRVLRPGDDGLVAAASHLFDGPARPDATARFLAEDGHHLLVAYEDDRAVGFVSGVEVTHPDKGTEMFLYELAVDEPFRRRGIGRALVERLAALARAAGCYGMWVITDHDNEAARATYEGTGGVPETRQVVEVWTF